MLSRNFLPQLVKCQATGTDSKQDVNAKRSADGKTLVLQVVNPGERAADARIHFEGFVPGRPVAQVWELSGPLEAVNTADRPHAVVPQESLWKHEIQDGSTTYAFPPHSFTVLRFE